MGKRQVVTVIKVFSVHVQRNIYNFHIISKSESLFAEISVYKGAVGNMSTINQERFAPTERIVEDRVVRDEDELSDDLEKVIGLDAILAACSHSLKRFCKTKFCFIFFNSSF